MNFLNCAQTSFVVGLAVDIVGAYVLAQGYIVKRLPDFTLEGTSGYGSPPNVRYIASAVAQKADAQVGFVILALGFCLQSFDYLALDQNAPPVLSTITALAVAVLAASTVSLLGWLVRKTLVTRYRSTMIALVLMRTDREVRWVRHVVEYLAPREAQRESEPDDAFVQRIVTKFAGEGR